MERVHACIGSRPTSMLSWVHPWCCQCAHHVSNLVAGDGLAGVARPAVQVVRLVLLLLA